MPKTQLPQSRQRLAPKKLLGAIIALIAVFLLASSVVTVATKYIGIRHHIKDLEEEQEALKAKHASLSKTNAYLATSDGEEQVLREKYNVVKPGEGMIVIVPTSDQEPETHTSSRVSRWWTALWHGLGFGKE